MTTIHRGPLSARSQAVHSQDAPFPFSQSRESTLTALEANLGLVYDGAGGTKWRIVKTSAIIPAAEADRAPMAYSNPLTYEVAPAAGAARIAGVMHPETLAGRSGQDIPSGSYIAIQVQGRCLLTASAAIAVGAGLESTGTAAKVVTVAPTAPEVLTGVAFAYAQQAAAADGDVLEASIPTLLG